ncbi:DUF1292 domain-containing protein [Anaerotalea alkaliphila]|uniref:DUF1292 domain-containing protein n=1 Tax=Anaerotalea alkaliphila TaxID=2662126 RepID=A0A7X5KNV8_9FIRM|nr:DUF1292 domain-containing protein [Anaerotalea alkaliphila]NDL68223.1 DUF1292 domain-containing protein [Anaerotalea alkaliphila]
MESIRFTFEETKEEVEFAVLSHIQHKDTMYLLVVEEEELTYDDDLTAYVLKVVQSEGDEVVYELVDDDKELEEVSGLLEAEMDGEFELQ